MKKSIKRNIKTNSRRETQLLGASFGAQFSSSPLPKEHALVVALKGQLGAGKTTFAQGVAKGLGVTEKILSPTFVIIKLYKIPDTRYTIQNLYHIDCYRIRDGQDLLSLGWKEIVSDPRNLVLIEWPEQIQKILPKDTIFISFETTTKRKRKITLPGWGS